MKNYSTFLKGAGVALMLLLAYLLYEWSALIPYSDYGTERIKNEQFVDFLKSGSLLALFAGIIIFSFFVAVYKQYKDDDKVKWAFRIALVGTLAIVISSYLRYDLYDTLKSTSEISKSKYESLQSNAKWIHYLSHGYALLVLALLLAYQSLAKNCRVIMPIIAVCLAVYFQNVSIVPSDSSIRLYYDTKDLTEEMGLMWEMLKIVLLYSSFAFLISIWNFIRIYIIRTNFSIFSSENNIIGRVICSLNSINTIIFHIISITSNRFTTII